MKQNKNQKVGSVLLKLEVFFELGRHNRLSGRTTQLLDDERVHNNLGGVMEVQTQ